MFENNKDIFINTHEKALNYFEKLALITPARVYDKTVKNSIYISIIL